MESSSNDRFRKLLECTICLDLYENPKSLKCGHEFCQRCLEGILVFRPNGSATITCPMRCAEKTVLKKDQTTNDLLTPYTVKNMLDTYEVDASKTNCQPWCQLQDDCLKPTTVYCCGTFMCTTCFNDEHMKNTDNDAKHSTHQLTFSARKNELSVLCEKHATRCTHAEHRTDQLYCGYCVRRGTKAKGSMRTIEEEVQFWKETLHTELQRPWLSEDLLEKTKSSVGDAKIVLKEVLEQRKMDCMVSYESFLDEEVSKLTELFDTTASSHIEMCEENIEKVKTAEKLNGIEKLDVEFILQSNAILELSGRFPRDIEVSLTDSNFKNDSPLGVIKSVAVPFKPKASRLSVECTWINGNVPVSDSNVSITSSLEDEERVVCKPIDNLPSQSRPRLRANKRSQSDSNKTTGQGDQLSPTKVFKLSPSPEIEVLSNAPQYKFECEKAVFGELNGTVASAHCGDNRIYLSMWLDICRDGRNVAEKCAFSVGSSCVRQVMIHFGRVPSFIAIETSKAFGEVACRRLGKQVLAPDSSNRKKRYIILVLKPAFRNVKASAELMRCLTPWTNVTILSQEGANKIIAESSLKIDQ